MKINQRQQNQPRTTLRLLDLDQAKAAVLASLRSPGSRRCYEHAIVEFIAWYCSEPRLGFNKAAVTRYRMHLESRGLAPGTVNLRLAAIRRLAYEAADSGLLSPEQAAGIRRVKGAKKLGIRVGNWLLANEVHQLFLQYSSRLNEQAAINSLVGHVHTLVVGITGLQPSGNLFGRPVQHQFTRNHVTQPAVAGQKTTLRAQRRHPCLAICIVGTISRTTTMASDLPAHRRGGSFQEPSDLTNRRIRGDSP